MKRRKIFLSLIILLGIIFVPFFAGCQNNNSTITLRTPQSVSYQINEGSGKQIIYTEENPFATAYLFGISETNTNIENFLKYEVKETDVNGKLKNYLDVTDIFLNAKTYYFYAQYLGEGKYLNSEISEIESTTIYHKYESPFLTMTDSVLSWSKVANADSYSVYANIDGNKELAFNTSGTTYDVKNYVNQKLKSGLSTKIDFTVCVDSYKNYLRSAESNSITYDSYLNLSEPTGLEIVVSGAQKLLRWTEVSNCDNYTIRINFINKVVVQKSDLQKSGSKLSYDISSVFDELGEYAFTVKANDTGNFIGSGYCDEVNYTLTQKLQAPKKVSLIDYGSFVEISWDEPELAVEYLLYFSDIANGGELKQFEINSDAGIKSPIVQNCIALTYEQLGITNFNQIKSASFLVKVQSKGYGYYLTSEMSSQKVALKSDEDVESPTIVDNQATSTISWEAIDNAEEYNIMITFGGNNETYSTKNTYFNYSQYLTEIGEYKIKCQTITKDNKISSYSNVITKTLYGKLEAPSITEITMEDDTFVIRFDDSEHAKDYSLYIYNNLIINNFTAINNEIDILSVITYQQNGVLQFTLEANANGFYTKSDKSKSYSISVKLATPTININNNTLSWDSILLATSYNLILDDKIIELNDISTSLNLLDYIAVNTSRQIRIQATNAYLEDSDASEKKYFSRSPELSGFSDKYFYYGQTYDYYITSDVELGDFLEFIFLNFIETPVKVYIDYDRSVSIKNKISSAKKQITGTRNYEIKMSVTNEYYGETTITFSHASKSPVPSYSALYDQYQYDMVYTGTSTRDSSYKFISDNYLVSQQVWSTDGLLSAIQHKATPEFMITDSVAEQIYNIAKSLLIELLDDSMTDYEKALILHDYLVETIAYDDYGLDHVSNSYLGYFHYIESALLYDLAVCDGYAKTYALLCGMEGIECIVIHGTYNKGGHAWNKIFLDLNDDGETECYAVDVTFDDLHVKNDSVTTEYLTHQFFLIPDSSFNNRVEDSNVTYPKAVSSEKFYSYHKPYGFSLKIDSSSTLDDFRQFMASNTETINLELLVLNSYISSNKIGGYSIDTKITYSPNSSYSMVFIHTN